MTKFGFRVISVHPGHGGLHKQWPRLHEHHNHWWQVLGVRIRPRTCHLSYNENLTRALNTTSLKSCLSSTDAIDRQEKIHACVWRFKVTSCECTSLKSPRFSQKKKKVYTFLTDTQTHRNLIKIFQRSQPSFLIRRECCSFSFSSVIKKGSCDHQNISIKIPCVCVCLSYGELFNFW